MDQRTDRTHEPDTEGNHRQTYDYKTHDELRQHLKNFVDAYNYAKRLNILKGLTLFEHIIKCWTEKPKVFKLNPIHHLAGPNI